jgi:hypothetical protein
VTDKLHSAALGSTMEATLFFAGDGRPTDGGGGSFDLSPRPDGDVESRASRRRLLSPVEG